MKPDINKFQNIDHTKSLYESQRYEQKEKFKRDIESKCSNYPKRRNFSTIQETKELPSRTISTVKESRDPTEDMDPQLLTSILKGCRNFSDLMKLYEGQKLKPYFNFIHMATLFGRTTNLFITGKNYIPIEKLTIFKDRILELVQKFNEWTLAQVAYDASTLLDYSIKINEKKIQELATTILDEVFEIILSKKLKHFDIKGLNSVAKSAFVLKYYSFCNDKENLEFSANEIIRLVFLEICKRHRNGEQFEERTIINFIDQSRQLMNFKFIHQEFKALSTLALRSLFENIQRRPRTWNVKDLTILSFNVTFSLTHFQNKYENLLALIIKVYNHTLNQIQNLFLKDSKLSGQEISEIALCSAQYFNRKNNPNLNLDLLNDILKNIENNQRDFHLNDLLSLLEMTRVTYKLAQRRGNDKLKSQVKRIQDNVLNGLEKKLNKESHVKLRYLAQHVNTLTYIESHDNRSLQLLKTAGSLVCSKNPARAGLIDISYLALSFLKRNLLDDIFPWILKALESIDVQEFELLHKVHKASQILFSVFLQIARNHNVSDKEQLKIFFSQYIKESLLEKIIEELGETFSNIEFTNDTSKALMQHPIVNKEPSEGSTQQSTQC